MARMNYGRIWLCVDRDDRPAFRFVRVRGDTGKGGFEKPYQPGNCDYRGWLNHGDECGWFQIERLDKENSTYSTTTTSQPRFSPPSTQVTYEAVRSYYITRNDYQDGRMVAWARGYERTGRIRDRRGDAISDGFGEWGHDDFNIAVWKPTAEGDRLVSWDWMDEPVDTEPGTLAEIERAVGKATDAEYGFVTIVEP